LKAICDKQQWNYDRGDNAGQLVTKVSQNGLFTHDFGKGLDHFIAALKTGLPSVRNDAGGHGESIKSEPVQAHIAPVCT
jgi:hypothetical protein